MIPSLGRLEHLERKMLDKYEVILMSIENAVVDIDSMLGNMRERVLRPGFLSHGNIPFLKTTLVNVQRAGSTPLPLDSFPNGGLHSSVLFLHITGAGAFRDGIYEHLLQVKGFSVPPCLGPAHEPST